MMESGKAKTGRVNASESSIKASLGSVAEGGRDGNTSERRVLGTCLLPNTGTQLPAHRGHPPRSYLQHAEHGNSSEVCDGAVGRAQARHKSPLEKG